MTRMRMDPSLRIWSPAPGSGGHGPDDRRGPRSCAVAGNRLFVNHCISQRATSSKILVEWPEQVEM